MVRYRQRRRQLAASRYERQQVRRTAEAQRRRRIGIVVGVVVGLIALAALIWLIISLASEDGGDQTPVVPTSNVVPTNFSDLPTGPASSTDTQPTTPGTTGNSSTGPRTKSSTVRTTTPSSTSTEGNP